MKIMRGADTRLLSLLLVLAAVAGTICAQGYLMRTNPRNIGSPPRFKLKPTLDVVAFVDRKHKFVCKVRGSPKPFLSWYHGNKLIGQSKRVKIGKYSLQISNLNKNDSGEYSCKAFNRYGILWGNFSLHVVQDEDKVNDPDQYEEKDNSFEDDFADLEGPPEFKKRLNQVGYLSRAATTSVDFNCDAIAYPAASITWWKNGQQVHKKGKYIIQDFMLTVKYLTLDDTGDYTCVVENEFGAVNWTTKLEVMQSIAIAPIMEDIKNQTALVGENVTFTCQIVMSDSQPLLQWLRHFKKNNSFVNEKGEPYVKILQSSGFKSTIDDPQHLVLHNVTKEDQGWYTCLVANTYGMNYKSAWLTVYNAGSPPRFKLKPTLDVVALVDRKHKFVCKVRGSPKPFLSWYHGNELIGQSKKVEIGKYSLQISNLNKNDSGEYSCKAFNRYGILWGNFSLHVVQDEDKVNDPDQYEDNDNSSEDEYADLEGPPEFKKRLNQVGYLSRAATTSVDFNCDAKAYPAASITWWKNGQQVDEEKGKYIIQDFMLTVKSLTLDDTGDYTCVVENEFGAVNWTTKLEVKQRIAIAPIMEDIKNQTALVGENVTFTCQIVMSDSQPLLQWLRHFKKNNSFVNEEGEPYVKILQSAGFKSTIDDPQHLVLRNVTKEDQGWYTCLVANTVGMNYRSAWLTVYNETEWETLLKMDMKKWI